MKNTRLLENEKIHTDLCQYYSVHRRLSDVWYLFEYESEAINRRNVE